MIALAVFFHFLNHIDKIDNIDNIDTCQFQVSVKSIGR